MHKRVMALLLSLVLLVSAIMPTTAMAAEDEGGRLRVRCHERQQHHRGADPYPV